MNKFQRLLSYKGNYLLAIVLWSIFSIISLKQGISLTNDSCTYLASAESWEDQGIFLDTFGNINKVWPPLYSVVITFIGTNEISLSLLNYFSILITILLWLAFYQRHYSFGISNYFFSILLSTSTAFLLCEKFVWSECLFILLVSIYFISLFTYLEKPSQKIGLIMSLAGVFIPLQRIAGVYIFFFAWLGLLLFYRNELNSHFIQIAIHIFVVILPFSIWFYATRGGLEVREEATFYFDFLIEVLRDFDQVTSRYFFPVLKITNYPTPFLFIFIIALLSVFYFIKDRKVKLAAFIYLGYYLAYILTIFMKKAGEGHQEVERFLAPTYPLLCYLLVFSFSQIIDSIQKINCKKIILFLLTLWTLYPIARASKNSIVYDKLPQKTGVNIPCDYLRR